MAYDFTPLKKRSSGIKDRLGQELVGVRTGRATSAILDSITVSLYGSETPIVHVAAITASDARTLLVAPWDKSQIKDIEKAITAANLGLAVAATDAGVRVSFPELTSDRRTQLAKLVSNKLEESKVLLRKERDAIWGDIQKKEKDGTVSEDEKFRLKGEMQKIVDETAAALDDLAGKKEAEIMN